MPTHVQELRIISNGQSAYVVYDSPIAPNNMAAQIVGVFEDHLPGEYLGLARLPVTPARKIDLDMFKTLAVIMPRFSSEWREPTHYQVFRSPMRSDLGPRRVTVFWSFDGAPPAVEVESIERIMPLDEWIATYENGVIVAMYEGYLVDPDGISRLESRWTNAAGYNALMSASRAFADSDDRSSYMAGMTFSDRRPKTERSVKKGAVGQDAGDSHPVPDAPPKMRRGKWKRTPKPKKED